MTGKDANTGAKRARELRTALGLPAGEPLPCVLTAVEGDLGLPVAIAALPEAIAGCCWLDGDRVVLWVNGEQVAVRQRFTLAHELGHVRCGHGAHLAVDTFQTLAGKTTDSSEIQANAFAAELLAPADGVRAMVGGEPTLEDVVLVAAHYRISMIAALIRLSSLGLTTRAELLRSEIDEGLHASVWDRLSPPPADDAIAALVGAPLPRLSPALDGSALAAMVAGAASVPAAAEAAGCDPARLASGAATIGA